MPCEKFFEFFFKKEATVLHFIRYTYVSKSSMMESIFIYLVHENTRRCLLPWECGRN